MKAIVRDTYGSPDVLQLKEIDKPPVGDDEALVRVQAASVNPADWHAMRGSPFVVQAAGVYQVLYERNIRVPDQMSVIGFDDVMYTAQMSPLLTTIHQPLVEIGKMAVSMLLRLIAGVTARVKSRGTFNVASGEKILRRTAQRPSYRAIKVLAAVNRAGRYGDPMGKNKTRPESRSATEFAADVTDAQRRADSLQLIELMRTATGVEPVMWGPSIIGYGTHHYAYESGREGDTFAVGFGPRAQALVLYGLGYDGQNPGLFQSLGTHTTGKGCLYVKRLSDINLDVLERMTKTAFSARHNVRPPT